MDSNAADQRPRVPLLWRGAYVCGAFIHFLASVYVVEVAYAVFGGPRAAWAVGVVLLSWLAFTVVVVQVIFGHMLPLRRRPVIATAGDGGWVDGDGDDGMDEGAISALPAAFTFQRDVQAAEGWAQCSICLDLVREGESVRRLPACGHLFHAGCVDGWLRAHATCPLCRAVVRAARPWSERLLPV